MQTGPPMMNADKMYQFKVLVPLVSVTRAGFYQVDRLGITSIGKKGRVTEIETGSTPPPWSYGKRATLFAEKYLGSKTCTWHKKSSHNLTSYVKNVRGTFFKA